MDLRSGATMSPTTDASRARRLEEKTAVILGAGGELGGAVAKEFTAQGARVFLSGQTKTLVTAFSSELM